MNIQALAAQIHFENVNVGWWDKWPNRADRFETAMMLTVTELSEACEGDRKSLPDDHLPHRPMLAVELADAAIRLLDLAGALDVKGLAEVVEQRGELAAEVMAKMSVPEMLFHIVKGCTADGKARAIKKALVRVIAAAVVLEIPLWEIVTEKREYNRQRPDHKPQARAQKHGKTY